MRKALTTLLLVASTVLLPVALSASTARVTARVVPFLTSQFDFGRATTSMRPDGRRILDVDARLTVRTNDPDGYVISIVPEPGVSAVEVDGLGERIVVGAAGGYSFQPLTSVGTSIRTVRFRVHLDGGAPPAAGTIPVAVRVHGLTARP